MKIKIVNYFKIPLVLQYEVTGQGCQDFEIIFPISHTHPPPPPWLTRPLRIARGKRPGTK